MRSEGRQESRKENSEYSIYCLRRAYFRTGGKFLYYASKCFTVSIAFNELEWNVQKALLEIFRKATQETAKPDSPTGSQ